MIPNQIKFHKILFVIHSLGNAGSERMCLNIINNLSEKKTPILYCYNYNGNNSYFELIENKKIILYTIKTNKQFKRISLFRKILKKEQPCVVLSFHFYAALLFYISNLFLNRKKALVRLGVGIKDTLNLMKGYKSKLWEIIIGKICKKVDKIICLSNDMANELKDFLSGKYTNKVIVINNFVSSLTPQTFQDMEINKYGKYILTIGRLEIQKNIEGIIRAFAKIKNRIDHNLLIIGVGSLKNSLEELINDNDLNERVYLLGFQCNPLNWLESADIYILNSFYEGFSNTLLEAVICKTPIITTDIPGINEVFRNGHNSLIVPVNNEEVLSENLLYLLKNSETAKNIADIAYNEFKIKNQDSIEEYNKLLKCE